MRIGELANLAGVSSRTIDYYTQIGLIQEVARSPGKHRLYSTDALINIKIIKELQKQHYTLNEIVLLFSGKENSKLFERVVSIRRHLDSLQQEVAQLYPAVRMSGSNHEVKALSRELINKGMQVVQALLVLLGEHVS
ncbi:MAG: MerR family transcriptional regulator [Bacillota bacterium]|jgi:MerR family copper efflux transcriptional regulator